MRNKQIFPVVLLIMLASLISACGGVAMNTSWPGVFASSDLAFVSNAQEVYAIKLSDGTQAWKFQPQTGAVPFYTPPVLTSDGLLLVGDYGKPGSFMQESTYTLYAIDTTNGAEKWRFTQATDLMKKIEATGHWIAPPLVVDKTIFAPNANSWLYVLDLKGQLLWKFKTNGALWSQPVADQQNIYFTSQDHFLYALNMSSHRQVWSADLGASSVSSPTIGKDGTLYVGTLGNEQLAIKPDTGGILWRTATSGSLGGAPVYKDGTLYLADMAGNVYSIAADTGKINWTYAAGAPITGSPVLLPDGLVVVTETGGLTRVGFDGKGSSMGPKADGVSFFGTPVLAGDGMLLVSTTGSGPFLYAYNQTTGALIWSFTPPK